MIQITLTAADSHGKLAYEYRAAIDPDQLFAVSREREPIVRAEGRDLVEFAVPFYVAAALRAGRDDLPDDLFMSMLNATMAVWLQSHLFDGLTEAEFAQSSLCFQANDRGQVTWARTPVQ